MIPLALANFSHFVSTLGFGKGFSRRRIVVGGGGLMAGPSGEVVVGREKRVERRDWVDVRVRARR